jgi:Protein of unknown function (DUF2442)
MNILLVEALSDYYLKVTFDNHITKYYDVSKMFHLEAFEPLKNIFLFKQVQVDSTGKAVMWNDEIDIAEYELWTNGYDEKGKPC